MTARQLGALTGWRILVPRGAEFGDHIAAAITSHGGVPVVAPMIEFSGSPDPEAFGAACRALAAGEFDWLVVTSSTTVDALAREEATIPPATRVAAVGEATSVALAEAGFRVDFVPEHEHSAAGLVAEWPTASGHVFLPQSQLAEPALAAGLARLGLKVDVVSAYRTTAVQLSTAVREDFASGRIQALLLTSGSVAREVRTQLGDVPEGTVVACIGTSTAAAARSAGLAVTVIAPEPSAASLVDALAGVAEARYGRHYPNSENVR